MEFLEFYEKLIAFHAFLLQVFTFISRYHPQGILFRYILQVEKVQGLRLLAMIYFMKINLRGYFGHFF